MAEHGHAERYRQHILDGDEPCAACREGERVKKANYRKRRYLNRGPMLVDATGTRRRIHALAAIGWSATELADRLGYDRSTISKWTQVRMVHVDTRARVIDLYEQLAMTPGPNRVARRVAAASGWPPPLLWDDETIDDPNAVPAADASDGREFDEVAIQRAMHGDRVVLTRSERREAVRRLVNRGRSEREIAELLDVTARMVARDKAAA